MYDVQDLAADAADLDRLADELADYDVVTAAEVGGGVVPIDPAARAAREAAGRLACLLAARADCVVQMFCGLPTILKGELAEMLIYLLRHGLTEYNAQKRYQGQRDIPLSPEGLAQLRRADIDQRLSIFQRCSVQGRRRRCCSRTRSSCPWTG